MCFLFYSNSLDRTLFYSNMTMPLCIRQGSKRNDDSVHDHSQALAVVGLFEKGLTAHQHIIICIQRSDVSLRWFDRDVSQRYVSLRWLCPKVSVEELDWSAESQILILAEHLWCDFKCRPWAKNSSPMLMHMLNVFCAFINRNGVSW